MPDPDTPFWSPYRTTESANRPRVKIRTNAPMVGIHLPTWNDRIAATTVNQMNPSRNSQSPRLAAPITGPASAPPSRKNTLNVVSARIASVPPTQIGLEIQ